MKRWDHDKKGKRGQRRTGLGNSHHGYNLLDGDLDDVYASPDNAPTIVSSPPSRTTNSRRSSKFSTLQRSSNYGSMGTRTPDTSREHTIIIGGEVVDGRHLKCLTDLRQSQYKMYLREKLRDVTVPTSTHAWLMFQFILMMASLSVVASFFVEEIVEHAFDEEIHDPQEEVNMAGNSALIFLIPNMLFALVPYYLQLRKKKIEIARAEGKLCDVNCKKCHPQNDNSLDNLSGSTEVHVLSSGELNAIADDNRHFALRTMSKWRDATSSCFKTCYNKGIKPNTDIIVDYGLIMFPQGLVGFSSVIALCLRAGKINPFYSQPWFFWPASVVSFWAYGRLYRIIEAEAVHEGTEHGLMSALSNLFGKAGLVRFKDQSGNWKPYGKLCAAMAYYIAWGILLHEFMEGTFIGNQAVKNTFKGLAATFPEHEEQFLKSSEHVGAYITGLMLGFMIVIFEGFMEAYNAAKNAKFYVGMNCFIAFITMLAALLHAIPTLVGVKELVDNIRGETFDDDDMMNNTMIALSNTLQTNIQATMKTVAQATTQTIVDNMASDTTMVTKSISSYGVSMLSLGVPLLPSALIGFCGTVSEAVVEMSMESTHGLKKIKNVVANVAGKLCAPVAGFCCFGRRQQDNRAVYDATQYSSLLPHRQQR